MKNNGSELILISSYDQLSKEDLEELTPQISLDDWDYMIFFDPKDKFIDLYQTEEDYYIGYPTCGVEKIKILTSDILDRLLDGSYKNQFYKVTFRGKKMGVAIAYHA